MSRPLNIVHVTPHLGGGVGKAHSAICAVEGFAIGRTYLLLEQAKDRRYVDEILKAGGSVLEAPGDQEMKQALEDADIVQIEFWNHPRLSAWMARDDLPPMRCAIWCHISGLFPPLIPKGLVTLPDRFLLTSSCSFEANGLKELSPDDRSRISVISSGFVLPDASSARKDSRRIAYLGTVDFVKMHPAIFDVIDRVSGDCVLDVWGAVAEGSDVAKSVSAMKSRHRVVLRGKTERPAEVLAEASIFLYLLQPRHYGTAENALVEAMSLGLAPIVLNNPAEAAIVRHGETGLIANSPEECGICLQRLLDNPAEARQLGDNARRQAHAQNQPSAAAADFRRLYDDLMAAPKSKRDFRKAIGGNPGDWFRAFWPEGEAGPLSGASKGGLSHFLGCFPDDPELLRLSAELGHRQEK